MAAIQCGLEVLTAYNLSFVSQYFSCYIFYIYGKNNCRLTEEFLLCVCECLAFNRNNQGHRYASQHPPGNGKIDVARIADLVPRLNGALPISYTQFPPKRKKNACKLLFRPRRSYPPARSPAQLFFSQLLIVFGGRIFHRRTTRVSVTLASSPLERTSEILSFSPALFCQNYVFLL